MHTYSIEIRSKENIRRKTNWIICVTSLIVTAYLDVKLGPCISEAKSVVTEWEGIDFLIKLIEITGVIPNVLSTAAIYKFIFLLYDKYLWKCGLFKKLHGVPNLNGVWNGELTSSYNGITMVMKMEIIQTWSDITFISTFEKSSSKSSMASFFIESEKEIEIIFVYRNQSSDQKLGTPSYEGCNKLTYACDNEINAVYFNNRPNNRSKFKGGNTGYFHLIRQS